MPKRRKLVLKIILTAVLVSVLSAALLIRRQLVVPVLMYHSVSPDARPENRLAVSADVFAQQMRFLKEKNYNVIPLRELALMIKEKKRIRPKTVAITFDDGHRDVYLYAFPQLLKYQLPATMFVILNEVGRDQGDRFSWDDIIEMRESGLVDFGSHCLGPEPLVNLESDEEIVREIFGSKKLLEKMIARPVELFSYPEGLFNDKIKLFVEQAGYLGAVATSPGKNFANDDAFAIKRLRISPTSDNLFVFWIKLSGIYTFIKERRDD
ncbi:polysaccharide deacetylase family protein [Candidatus Omnitrophota bacterium]